MRWVGENVDVSIAGLEGHAAERVAVAR